MSLFLPGKILLPLAWGLGSGLALAAAGWGGWPHDDPSVPTTLRDYHFPGTQEGGVIQPLWEVQECAMCHGDYNAEHEPFRPWAASMMGQGARDPIFWAALTVSEQAAKNVGDLCIRCHVARGWIEGRSQPPSGGGLEPGDLQGITCITCHRMVDPVYDDGVSPKVDREVLADLAQLPVGFHSAQFVIDPLDRRRGPLDLGGEFYWHQWERSPFHREATMCATCHDVTNPLFDRQPDGRYQFNEIDTPHPTYRAEDGFPLERTYSEWKASAFSRGPVDMGGRFGGQRGPLVSTCQDCHMPTTTGTACNPMVGGVVRDDLPLHDFRGATNWMLDAVRNLYPDPETMLSAESVAAAQERNREFMRGASDMDLALVEPSTLYVRIVNQTGHKLPTGHLEGRRMWVNVRFFDKSGALVREYGAYNPGQATLVHDTKVYEAIVGLDEAMAAYLGVAPGPSHLFPLNNKFFQDNRIPPRGFTNEGFRKAQAEPVGHSYQDGQYWDHTGFGVPAGAVRAEARLFYQTITKEAVEGLRDANVTNDTGQVLYDQWVAAGKGPPVEMDSVEIDLRTACRADFNGDGALNLADLGAFQGAYASGEPRADVNYDGVLSLADFGAFRTAFALGCP
ncbi:MAG: hypothetical protein IT437_14380 [Phycisphaerales bacterium]|nr:hypothetical protein [Phycisphaerales bacterium]